MRKICGVAIGITLTLAVVFLICLGCFLLARASL